MRDFQRFIERLYMAFGYVYTYGEVSFLATTFGTDIPTLTSVEVVNLTEIGLKCSPLGKHVVYEIVRQRLQGMLQVSSGDYSLYVSIIDGNNSESLSSYILE